MKPSLKRDSDDMQEISAQSYRNEQQQYQQSVQNTANTSRAGVSSNRTTAEVEIPMSGRSSQEFHESSTIGNHSRVPETQRHLIDDRPSYSTQEDDLVAKPSHLPNTQETPLLLPFGEMSHQSSRSGTSETMLSGMNDVCTGKIALIWICSCCVFL